MCRRALGLCKALACELIEVFSSWGDERLVSALITYLENSRFVYEYGDDLGIPALKARQALEDITGHWFPLDVDKSMDAWHEAREVRDRTKRKELLRKLDASLKGGGSKHRPHASSWLDRAKSFFEGLGLKQ